MSSFYPPQPVARVIARPITDDIPCRRCQYNLRGLQSEALCPECGAAVMLSLHGDLIRYSDPKWIERIARGANWSFWSVFVIAAFIVFYVWNQLERTFNPITPRLISIGVDCFVAAGAWLLTTADPSGLGEDRYARSRKFSRCAAVAQVLQGLLNLTLYAATLPPTLYQGLVVLWSIIALVASAGFVSRMRYTSILAARITDQTITTKARNLQYTLGIPLLISMAMACLATLARATGNRKLFPVIPFGLVYALNGLLILIFNISYLLMLRRLYTTLRKQHAFAEQNWNTMTVLSNDNPLPPV